MSTAVMRCFLRLVVLSGPRRSIQADFLLNPLCGVGQVQQMPLGLDKKGMLQC
jgi:hypothetical protein